MRLFSIYNRKNYSSNAQFQYLEEGIYSVSVKDKKDDCESEQLKVIIEGFQCNYIIHPERLIYLDKSLKDFRSDATVEVIIFNKIGNIIFNKTILTTENLFWEGNSNTNQPVPMGNYTYLIKSGNKVSKGEITIIR